MEAIVAALRAATAAMAAVGAEAVAVLAGAGRMGSAPVGAINTPPIWSITNSSFGKASTGLSALAR